MIGIWWDDGARIVAFPIKVDAVTSVCGFWDVDESHDSRWSLAAVQFDVSSELEYFSIPRGRGIYDCNKRMTVVYHVNRTDSSRLKLIAARFELDQWVARIDDHHSMGSAIDHPWVDFSS